MPKKPISVTLEEDNLLWLRGRSASAKRRSLSDALDQLITAVRQGAHSGERRSVVGTVDIAADDPRLDGADAAVQSLIYASVSRPSLVSETPPPYGKAKPKRRG